MSAFGNISAYDASVESWDQYAERLQQFFVANEITDADRQRAIFLTVIGPETYALLRNLLSPETPVNKNLSDLIKILNEHFHPIPSEIVERFKFNTRVRCAGETVATFIAELRRLAKYCNFGSTLDQMLRDRIVCGIQDEAIQRKLLAENKLTLTRATEIALAMEAAERDASDLRNVAGDVNKIRPQYNSRNVNFKKEEPGFAVEKAADFSSGGRCYRCGDPHQEEVCRFKNVTCHFCKKPGHIAKVCNSKKKK